MAVSTKIKVPQCPECGRDFTESYFHYCSNCRRYAVLVERDKRRVTGEFKVVGWFSSRSSAGLTIEDSQGNKHSMYMSDIFRYLDGTNLGQLTLEETKKGSAYGWCVVSEKEAVN